MAVLGGKTIKELKGVVLSNKTNKTIVVEVETVKMHPLFKKRFRTQKKYYAHDESNKAQEGDVVLIRQTRPMSKMKRWKLVSIIKSVEMVA